MWFLMVWLYTAGDPIAVYTKYQFETERACELGERSIQNVSAAYERVETYCNHFPRIVPLTADAQHKKG